MALYVWLFIYSAFVKPFCRALFDLDSRESPDQAPAYIGKL